MNNNSFFKMIAECLGILILITIIFIAKASDMKDNMASMLGGVLSAIATVVLGLIAVLQNKAYNDRSSEFVNKQQNLLSNIKDISNQQKLFLQRNGYYELFTSYRKKIERYFDLFKKYNSSYLESIIVTSTFDNKGPFENFSLNKSIASELGDFLLFMCRDIYFFQGKEMLFNASTLYIKEVNKLFEGFYTRIGEKEGYVQNLDKIKQIYTDLDQYFAEYILIVDQYSLKILNEDAGTEIENIRSDIIHMHEKQTEWKKSISEDPFA